MTMRHPMRASLTRIGAMLMRYLYLLKGSWPRLLDLVYWPTIQMVLWGFTSQFFATNSSWVARVEGVLLGAVLLWDVLWRSQLGVSLSFLEEMWARSLGNLFVTPLRPYEWVLSFFAMSFVRVVIATVPAMLLAIPFYHYSIFTLGLPLIAFFGALMAMGWAVGLVVISLILRYGMGAEGIAWAVIFLLAPVSAVYYPVSILPTWLQAVAMILPSAHVFEGMRAVMMEHRFLWDRFGAAVFLDLLYLGIGMVAFLYSFAVARERGALLQMGE